MVTRANRSLAELGASLALNIVLPAAILLRFSSEAYLGPVAGLLTALAFPVSFGLYDLIGRGRFNPLSLLGVAGALLTGGIGLFRLDAHWVAVKEASVPLIIGLAILLSRFTSYPVVTTLLSAAIDFERVRTALANSPAAPPRLEQRLRAVTYLVAGSFFLSAILNYVLARLLVESPPGTVAFNEELGRLAVISYPIIALPSLLVMWAAVAWLIAGIHRWSGLSLTKIFRG
jgi:hypothetical protein